jgi:hypothetical protein
LTLKSTQTFEGGNAVTGGAKKQEEIIAEHDLEGPKAKGWSF